MSASKSSRTPTAKRPEGPVAVTAKPAYVFTIDARKLAPLVLLIGASAVVVILFLSMIGPAAAREVRAACNGMRPTWQNDAFKQLPAEAPDFALVDVRNPSYVELQAVLAQIEQKKEKHASRATIEALELKAERLADAVEASRVTLASLKGKVVLVNFWASWCGVCKTEKKSMAALTRNLGGDDFVVLSLASDADYREPELSLRTAPGMNKDADYGGAPFHVLLDPPEEGTMGPTAQAWGVQKVPDSFLIDRKGRIRMYLVNKRDWSAGVVETCVQSLIDE